MKRKLEERLDGASSPFSWLKVLLESRVRGADSVGVPSVRETRSSKEKIVKEMARERKGKTL